MLGYTGLNCFTTCPYPTDVREIVAVSMTRAICFGMYRDNNECMYVPRYKVL